jgi:hypothetical protein
VDDMTVRRLHSVGKTLPAATRPARAALLLVALVAVGCAGRGRSHGELVAPTMPLLPEHALLDVQVLIFDPGLPETEQEGEEGASAEKREGEDAKETGGEDGVYPTVRRAEALYFPCKLRGTLAGSGQWGAVEVTSRRSDALEVTVEGRILESDGETFALEIQAWDATGRRWLDGRYGVKTTEGQYMMTGRDPYQPVFNAIANDLAEKRNELSDEDLRTIREVSELRFAEEFAPDSFAGFLERDDGEVRVVRLPARDDPMYALLAEVRGRESMFIATQSGHFEQFCATASEPYSRWRWFAREETVAYKKLRRDALIRKGGAVGLAALAVGAAVMGNPAGIIELAAVTGVAGTALLWSAGNQKMTEADFHRDTLDELSQSFQAEVRPMVVEVEGRTVRLTGSVDEQYDKWRELLHQLYLAESAMPRTLDAHILGDGEVAEADPEAPAEATGAGPVAPPPAGASGVVSSE